MNCLGTIYAKFYSFKHGILLLIKKFLRHFSSERISSRFRKNFIREMIICMIYFDFCFKPQLSNPSTFQYQHFFRDLPRVRTHTPLVRFLTPWTPFEFDLDFQGIPNLTHLLVIRISHPLIPLRDIWTTPYRRNKVNQDKSKCT